jgi:hypothetical protein
MLAYLRGNDMRYKVYDATCDVEREEGPVCFLAVAVEARRVSLRKNGKFNN